MSLADGLTAYWKLDELNATDNAADSHSNNIVLSQFNSPSQGAGKLGPKSRQFVASSTQRLSTSHSFLNFGDSDYSFSLWIWQTEQAATRGILGKDDGGTRQYRLDVDTALGVRWFTFDPGGGVAGQCFPGNVTIGSWYHVICWHDAAANQVGAVINNGTPATAASAAPGINNPNFTLGDGGTIGNGFIDEVGVWNRPLTTQERTDLYNGGAGLAYESFFGPALNAGAESAYLPGGLQPQTWPTMISKW
jgi:hypothetical protein